MRRLILTFCLLAVGVIIGAAQSGNNVPLDLRLRLLRAEDTRNWNEDARQLLKHADPQVRLAAALTAGRIGDERANPALVELLQRDNDPAVQAMAAFALGEIETEQGAEQLIAVVSNARQWPPELRARALEALGKITAALPESAKEIKALYGKAILDALRFEAGRRSAPDEAVILAGVTAALRTRPEGAGAVVAEFLGYSSPRVRADTLNALARLRAKEKLPEVRQLLQDPDPIIRANAARVLGGAEDKSARELLLNALNDKDARVRVAAIRALGALKEELSTAILLFHLGLTDIAAVEPIIDDPPVILPRRGKRRGRVAPIPTIIGAKIGTRTAPETGTSKPPGTGQEVMPSTDSPELLLQGSVNEVLEILAALNNSYPDFPNEKLYDVIGRLKSVPPSAPEWNIAIAKSNPSFVLGHRNPFVSGNKTQQTSVLRNWRLTAAMAQGLAAITTLKNVDANRANEWRKEAEKILSVMLNHPQLSPVARPEVLQAFAACKPANLREVALRNLVAKDVVVRSTAADLLGDLPPGEENTKALADALPIALKDSLNDAAMSILGALAKQKSDKANAVIKSALAAADYLVRWRAIELLKRNGVGDFSAQKFPVKSQWTEADYREALGLKNVKALVETDKGAFTIQLRPDVAPLNVLSFVRLARRGYFNGITWHRVVPNFVIQGGDPRGDGNGGPGYALRCEINQLTYERGAVGMALSGKDTGGSQWFVTHSPQPHLDGGYTVFGNVSQGLETVDKIARGDKIRRIRILVGR